MGRIASKEEIIRCSNDGKAIHQSRISRLRCLVKCNVWNGPVRDELEQYLVLGQRCKWTRIDLGTLSNADVNERSPNMQWDIVLAEPTHCFPNGKRSLRRIGLARICDAQLEKMLVN